MKEAASVGGLFAVILNLALLFKFAFSGLGKLIPRLRHLHELGAMMRSSTARHRPALLGVLGVLVHFFHTSWIIVGLFYPPKPKPDSFSQ